MKVKCEVCGQERSAERMIQRKLNGRKHYCCSIGCEVTWEKQNLMGVCG